MKIKMARLKNDSDNVWDTLSFFLVFFTGGILYPPSSKKKKISGAALLVGAPITFVSP